MAVDISVPLELRNVTRTVVCCPATDTPARRSHGDTRDQKSKAGRAL